MNSNTKPTPQSVWLLFAGFSFLFVLSACTNETGLTVESQTNPDESPTSSLAVEPTTTQMTDDIAMVVTLEELVRLENPNSAEPGTSLQSIYLDLFDGEPFTTESDDIQAHTLQVEEIPVIEAEETDTSTEPDVYYRLTAVGWVEATQRIRRRRGKFSCQRSPLADGENQKPALCRVGSVPLSLRSSRYAHR